MKVESGRLHYFIPHSVCTLWLLSTHIVYICSPVLSVYSFKRQPLPGLASKPFLSVTHTRANQWSGWSVNYTHTTQTLLSLAQRGFHNYDTGTIWHINTYKSGSNEVQELQLCEFSLKLCKRNGVIIKVIFIYAQNTVCNHLESKIIFQTKVKMRPIWRKDMDLRDIYVVR